MQSKRVLHPNTCSMLEMQSHHRDSSRISLAIFRTFFYLTDFENCCMVVVNRY